MIYDGKDFYTGLTPAFEPSRDVVRYVICNNLDLSQAAYKAGLTTDEKIGATEGLSSILTKGRIPRIEQLKPAIIYAMIGVERARERK